MTILKTRIELPSDLIQNLKNKNNKSKILLQTFLNNNPKLANMFNGHSLFYADTLGEVHTVNIDKDNIKIDKLGKGEFLSEFTVFYYFGCDDLNSEIDQEISTYFTIDFVKNEIIIETEDIPEREYYEDEF